MTNPLRYVRNGSVTPQRLVDDPALVPFGLNKTYHELRRGGEYNPAGTDIFADKDWDNLILLDACRYDTYCEEVGAEVGACESRGSASKQFVRGNFAGKTLHDVVYISGNRWYLKLRDELDCEVHAFHDVERDAADGFVPSAEAVTEAVLDLKKTYPEKRLLIHYMQPHAPYLGAGDDPFEYERDGGIRQTVRANEIDGRVIPGAYRENLRYVLEHVDDLIEELDGKTVVSSDHGEMLGDRLSPIPIRWYGHPPGIYTDPLVTVPWHVVSEGPRRDITASPPTQEINEVETDELDRQLRHLGYKV